MAIQIRSSSDTDSINDEEFNNSVDFSTFNLFERTVKYISSKLKEVVEIQDYQIEKESSFAATQHENGELLVFLTVLQIGLVLIFGVFQILSIRKKVTNACEAFS